MTSCEGWLGARRGTINGWLEKTEFIEQMTPLILEKV